MNEQGVAAYIGCFQSPVGIAASQAAAKYNTPFLIDVGASDLIVSRGLKNIFRLHAGLRRLRRPGHLARWATLNKAANGVAKTAVIVHEFGRVRHRHGQAAGQQAAGASASRPRK